MVTFEFNSFFFFGMDNGNLYLYCFVQASMNILEFIVRVACGFQYSVSTHDVLFRFHIYVTR
jgi:hypothetical protein